jgi:hypothetical protein
VRHAEKGFQKVGSEYVWFVGAGKKRSVVEVGKHFKAVRRSGGNKQSHNHLQIVKAQSIAHKLCDAVTELSDELCLITNEQREQKGYIGLAKQRNKQRRLGSPAKRSERVPEGWAKQLGP